MSSCLKVVRKIEENRVFIRETRLRFQKNRVVEDNRELCLAQCVVSSKMSYMLA